MASNEDENERLNGFGGSDTRTDSAASLMSRGKYISLEEARKAGQIEQFCKEHPSTGDWDRFTRLFEAMAHGEPPTRRKPKAAKTSSRDDGAC